MIHALLFLAIAIPDAQQAKCPKLGVAFGATKTGGPTFRVTARPVLWGGNFTFNWSLSVGTIRAGQGTGKI